MDEKKIEEYINRFNKNFEEFEKNHKSEMDKYVEEFNKKFESYMAKIDKRLEESENNLNKYMVESNKQFEESERRQNGRLAYIEQTYGDKINAIFDKIMVMDEYIQENNKELKKAIQKLEKHDDILYSHNFRITNLENKIESV